MFLTLSFVLQVAMLCFHEIEISTLTKGEFAGMRTITLLASPHEKGNKLSFSNITLENSPSRRLLENLDDPWCLLKLYDMLRTHYGNDEYTGRVFRRIAYKKQLKVSVLVVFCSGVCILLFSNPCCSFFLEEGA